MTKKLWKALDLLEDSLLTGFSREHPDIEVDEAARQQGAPAPQAAPAPPDPIRILSMIAAEVGVCTRCALSMGRKAAVPGEGAPRPPVLFVGEGPGEEEDRTGRPFVGAAGKYLDKWIAAAGLERGACFIANCVKCRPPQNREPHPDELAACAPFLERQISALGPRVICCLGRIASHTLLATSASLGDLRGRVHNRKGIPVVVTYHPSAVLRDQSLRGPVWQDLKLLMTLL
jgi:uracil-DNA glycosylase family 4